MPPYEAVSAYDAYDAYDAYGACDACDLEASTDAPGAPPPTTHSLALFARPSFGLNFHVIPAPAPAPAALSDGAGEP